MQSGQARKSGAKWRSRKGDFAVRPKHAAKLPRELDPDERRALSIQNGLARRMFQLQSHEKRSFLLVRRGVVRNCDWRDGNPGSFRLVPEHHFIGDGGVLAAAEGLLAKPVEDLSVFSVDRQ